MEAGTIEWRCLIATESDDSLYGLTGGASDNPSALNDRASLLQQLHQNIRDQLAGQAWDIASYNPLSFIISHSEFNQIISAIVKKKKRYILDEHGNDTSRYDLIPYLVPKKIIIAARPVEVISHVSPQDSL